MGSKATLDNWANALKSRNVEEILNVYSNKAILLGTFAKSIKQGHKEIGSYFEGLVKKDNLRVEFTEIIKQPCVDLTLYSGHYIFRWRDNFLGLDKEVLARYTFAIGKERKVWKIVQHHSSLQNIW